MQQIIRVILKLIVFTFLTLITQIGGVIYLIIEFSIKRNIPKYRFKKLGICIIVYMVMTFLIVPNIAPILGREKIKDTSQIKAHSFFTKLLNRNYVTPRLHKTLEEVANEFQHSYPEIQLMYLDANFPFINGFPLAPHLSHNDGKKIDLSFIYKDQNHKITNKKPSNSGYGIYEPPTLQEYDQSHICKQKGYWQYDITQFITLGTTNKGLKLSEKATKDLLLEIVKHKQVQKVFIEPHLKVRMKVQSFKIRFHGCQAVRHDDHIHLQLR